MSRGMLHHWLWAGLPTWGSGHTLCLVLDAAALSRMLPPGLENRLAYEGVCDLTL